MGLRHDFFIHKKKTIDSFKFVSADIAGINANIDNIRNVFLSLDSRISKIDEELLIERNNNSEIKKIIQVMNERVDEWAFKHEQIVRNVAKNNKLIVIIKKNILKSRKLNLVVKENQDRINKLKRLLNRKLKALNKKIDAKGTIKKPTSKLLMSTKKVTTIKTGKETKRPIKKTSSTIEERLRPSQKTIVEIKKREIKK